MVGGRTVTVVIPAYQAAGRIAVTVRAAIAQEETAPPPEVIVVDDGSADDTAAVAERAGARVIRQENRGPAAARNTGWRAAKGEIVFFTDSDCVPRPDWVRRLAPLFDEEDVGGVGGSYDAANLENLLAACVQEEIAVRHRRMGPEVRFLGSFNLAAPRRVLEETGGFDETYRRASGEDNDLSYRIRKLGYRLLFEPAARVAHRHPESVRRYLVEQARHGYWRMKLYREHPERIGGDDYSGLADFVEPPAAALFLLLLPLRGSFGVARLSSFLFVLLVVAALPTTFRMVKSGGTRLALFLPIRVARAFARGIGMGAGVVRYWLTPFARRAAR